ncbi:ARMT1-like domain-containing protein [Methanohalophilus sp.]|uniref:damage-control phosphatase ARMT1 family protein n=1 Tax=Methanohalophilus sp. TaxID=1966352 RepID=UPI002627E9B2|nr:ARMT1-like domain-containing protein [Methanohalophilus sp.]MDK2891713.1 damage-control phosphatase, subfamily [Methanohalophilus sp.]
MKMDPRCIYCLLSRVHYESKLSTQDEQLIHKTLISCMDVIKEQYVPGVAAGHVSTAVHRKAYEILNDPDPYYDLKQVSNHAALGVYPLAKALIYKGNPDSKEIFRRAVLAAVIGNFFDFGVMGLEVGENNFEAIFTSTFEKGLDVDDTDRMFDLTSNTVYVADNCGEIILDTLVFDIIREHGGKVTLVIRGEPMLTDVTMEDVKALEIEEHVDKIITTGCNAVGVSFEEAPDELLEAFDNASLIISKGMANYETLSEKKLRPIAYLLRTKCDAVANDMRLEKDCSVAKLFMK